MEFTSTNSSSEAEAAADNSAGQSLGAPALACGTRELGRGGDPQAIPPADSVAGHPVADPAAERPLRRIPAWLLSIALHLTGMISLALMIQPHYEGAAVEPDRSGGIVLVQQRGGGEPEYFSESSANSAASAASSVAPLDSPLPGVAPVDADPMAGLLPSGESMAGLAGTVGGGLPDAANLGESGGSSRKLPDGATQTSVFGVSGTGSKFVYVFDRSASMAGFQGRPLAAAKRELMASLNSLNSIHQFQVIFYNDQFDVMHPTRTGPARLLFGDERGKAIAKEFIGGITALGGTQHYSPLMTALRMQPDVIFFLTDAAERSLTTDELNRIRELNLRVGASIHAIEFGAGPGQGGARFLQQLARDNGGHYSYVDVTRLPESR